MVVQVIIISILLYSNIFKPILVLPGGSHYGPLVFFISMNDLVIMI